MTPRRLRQVAGDGVSGWVLFDYLGLLVLALERDRAVKPIKLRSTLFCSCEFFEVIFLTMVRKIPFSHQAILQRGLAFIFSAVLKFYHLLV